jgi:opacity protein-like surface antigen
MKLVPRILLVSGLGICVALPSMAAQPDEQMYAELSYAWLHTSGGGFSVTSDDLIGRFGYEFSKNLGAEVFLGTNVSSGSLFGVSVKVGTAYGAYMKARAEVAPGLELFGKLGFVHASLDASAPGISVSNSDTSFSYGVGMQYTFTQKWYMQADYMSYYDKSGDTIKGPSIGVGLRF